MMQGEQLCGSRIAMLELHRGAGIRPRMMPRKKRTKARSSPGTELSPGKLDPARLEGVEELLSKRPLIPGEDPTLYDALLARVREAVRPFDIIEHIWVKDIVDLVWEMQRWRRLRAATFAQAHREVLREALNDLLGARQKPGLADEIGSLVIGWARGREEAVERVEGILRDHHLDIDALMARVLDKHLQRLERVDQLIAGAELRRDSILREIDRRRSILVERMREVIEAEESSDPAHLLLPNNPES
jgi:hypothetical protein